MCREGSFPEHQAPPCCCPYLGAARSAQPGPGRRAQEGQTSCEEMAAPPAPAGNGQKRGQRAAHPPGPPSPCLVSWTPLPPRVSSRLLGDRCFRLASAGAACGRRALMPGRERAAGGESGSVDSHSLPRGTDTLPVTRTGRGPGPAPPKRGSSPASLGCGGEDAAMRPPSPWLHGAGKGVGTGANPRACHGDGSAGSEEGGTGVLLSRVSGPPGT